MELDQKLTFQRKRSKFVSSPSADDFPEHRITLRDRIAILLYESLKTNFYLKLKGEIEDAVLKTKHKSLFILKPSLLIGKRKNSRFIESIGQIIMPLFSILLPDSIKAVKANTVAKCMLELSKSELSNLNIIENKEILSYR